MASPTEAKQFHTRLALAEVIQLANQAAESSGYKLTEFEGPIADFEPFVHDKKWLVFFAGKVPAPGNHFIVRIDDRSGSVQLVPGH